MTTNIIEAKKSIAYSSFYQPEPGFEDSSKAITVLRFIRCYFSAPCISPMKKIPCATTKHMIQKMEDGYFPWGFSIMQKAAKKKSE